MAEVEVVAKLSGAPDVRVMAKSAQAGHPARMVAALSDEQEILDRREVAKCPEGGPHLRPEAAAAKHSVGSK
jgi:hypothetical protein